MFKTKIVPILLFFALLFLTRANAQIPQPPNIFPLKPSLLKQARFIKPLEPDYPLHFTVWLKYRNKKDLDRLANELYDPKSANYQKFLKPGEFEDKYAPSEDVKKLVANYFLSQGMQAKIIHHRIDVTAKTRQIEKTFQVKLNYYQYHDRIVYAYSTQPKLKTNIAEHISQISGLSNIKRYYPAIRKRPNLKNAEFKPHDLNFKWDKFVPLAQPTTTSFVGFTGSLLRHTFNLNSIPRINGINIDGNNHTLVIIDACGTNSADQIKSDGNLYNSANGLPLFTDSNFKVINPDGTPFMNCTNPDAPDWDGEIALDVEASHTIAPGAKTVLVLAQTDFAPLDTAIDDVTNRLINNNYTIAGFSNAYVVSNSWGGSETTGSEPGVEANLQKAAVHAISFNFSTGDCGDQTYASTWPCTIQDSNPSIEFPASSAFVTAVGGTSLFVDNNWNYAFEGLWGSYLDAFFAGTTGGISKFYGPVEWQSSISSFTAGGYTGTVGSHNKRAVPDVSMLADPYTGLTIYEGGTSFVFGGTSLACPLFSGTLVLLSQMRALLNGNSPRPIGQAAPYFYVNNSALIRGRGLNLVVPPHIIISGAENPPSGAPISAFRIFDPAYGYHLTFGWDSSLTIQPESQFWNDGVGVGSVNIPNFLSIMGTM